MQPVTDEQQRLDGASSSGFRFRHFPQLDELRGLAVLLVVVGHWAEFSGTKLAAAGGSAAQLGVLLFFVLSGFLITGLLLEEERRNGAIDLRAFYARRVLRLAPAFLLFFASVALLSKLKLITDVPLYEFAVCILYVRNIFGRSDSMGHLWSLSLEEQFYTFWPLTVKLIPASRLLAAASLTAALIATARTAGIAGHWAAYEGPVFYMRPWFRFDSILAGCCVVIALVRGDRAGRGLERLVSRIPAFVLWGALFGWSLYGETISRPLYITIQVLLSALALAQLVVAAPAHVALVAVPFRFLGKISYSLYLWQQLFLVTRFPSWGPLRSFPLNLAVPFALAIASFYLIERPALTLKSRLRPNF